MKHNEMKAYFKKQLQKKLQLYSKMDIVSIDKSSMERDMYVVDSEMQTRMLVSAYFGSEQFSIKAYKSKGSKMPNKYKDAFFSVSSNYMEVSLMADMIQTIINAL